MFQKTLPVVDHNHTPHQQHPTTQVEGPESVADLVLRADTLFEELMVAWTASHVLPSPRTLTLAREGAF